MNMLVLTAVHMYDLVCVWASCSAHGVSVMRQRSLMRTLAFFLLASRGIHMKTAQQAQAAWLAAMGAASTKQKYVDGINGFTGNPMALAATQEAMQAYVDGVQRSVDSGRRAAALNGASVADWKNNATTIGAQRLASGAQKAQAKYLKNIAPYAAVWPQMRAAARALPKGGLANAQARAAAALQVIMQAAGTA